MLKKLIYLGIFLVIFGLSEILYRITNERDKIVSTYAVFQAQRASRNNEVQKALNILSWAAEINIKDLSQNYSGLVPKDYKIILLLPKSNQALTDSMANYIKAVDLARIANSEEGDLARVFYTLAIISFRSGDDDLVPPLFQTAVYLNPDLSLTHVEYANYYLLKGDKSRGEEIVNFCLKFPHAQKHCQDFKEGDLAKGIAHDVGFLTGELDKYYQSK